MDFTFSEDQESVRALAAEILEKEATHERVREVEGEGTFFDAALWAKLAEASLLGLAVPEAEGGMGFGFLEVCVLLEEAGRRCAPVPVLESLVLGGLPLARFGTDAQRTRWLPALAGGEATFTAALAGAGAPELPRVAARRAGDGVTLAGSASAVPYARGAARILVPASLDGGVAIFLVDPVAAGVALEGRTVSTGQPLFEVSLDGVAAGEDDVLGGPSADGDVILAWLHAHAAVATAALQVGVSSEALAITARYVSEREQFGTPIGSFQAVQHRAADAFIDLQALRWCTWRAAWRLAEGLPAAREAAVAKFWAADAGARIAAAGLHLHGGLGSDVDYPIHRYFLWSRSLELQLGGATPQLAWLGRDMARTGPAQGLEPTAPGSEQVKTVPEVNRSMG